MFDNHFFNINLLDNLVNRQLQYFGTFSVIINLYFPCVYNAAQYLVRICRTSLYCPIHVLHIWLCELYNWLLYLLSYNVKIKNWIGLRLGVYQNINVFGICTNEKHAQKWISELLYAMVDSPRILKHSGETKPHKFFPEFAFHKVWKEDAKSE
jgi:hypothetical protein